MRHWAARGIRKTRDGWEGKEGTHLTRVSLPFFAFDAKLVLEPSMVFKGHSPATKFPFNPQKYSAIC
jgi:hypothetical protein